MVNGMVRRKTPQQWSMLLKPTTQIMRWSHWMWLLSQHLLGIFLYALLAPWGMRLQRLSSHKKLKQNKKNWLNLPVLAATHCPPSESHCLLYFITTWQSICPLKNNTTSQQANHPIREGTALRPDWQHTQCSCHAQGGWEKTTVEEAMKRRGGGLKRAIRAGVVRVFTPHSDRCWGCLCRAPCIRGRWATLSSSSGLWAETWKWTPVNLRKWCAILNL